ncbi:MAG: MATE family efflux transporter [Treponema sp. CETP13]|nr:MAG: MATE family efflux transporter [Treponema sp. CETP13]
MDKKFLKTLAIIAVPITLQNLLQTLVNLVDNVMIGQLGAVQIGAVGLGNQVFFVLNLILFGISSGGGVFIAQFWGKKDLKGIHKTVGLMLTGAIIVGLVFALLSLFLPGWLLSLYTNDLQVITSGIGYLRISSVGFLIFAISFPLEMVLRSSEEVKIPLYATILSLITNIVFDYVFIFLFRWGVKGAAFATVLARLVEGLYVYGIAYKRKLPQIAKLSEYLSFQRSFVARFFKIAFPVVINESLWGLGITIENGIYAHVGTDALAAFNITSTVQMLVWVIFIGIGNAASVILGNVIGSGDNKKAHEYAFKLVRTMVLLALATGWLLIPISKLLPLLYNVDPYILDQARLMLMVIVFVYPFRAFNMCMVVGVMRSGGDTVYGGIADIGGLWGCGLVCGTLAAFVLHLEPWLIFAAFSMEDSLKFIMGVIRLKSGKWLHNVVDNEAS